MLRSSQILFHPALTRSEQRPSLILHFSGNPPQAHHPRHRTYPPGDGGANERIRQTECSISTIPANQDTRFIAHAGSPFLKHAFFT